MIHSLAGLLCSIPLFVLSCGIFGAALGKLPENPDFMDLVPVTGSFGSVFLALVAVFISFMAAPRPAPARGRR